MDQVIRDLERYDSGGDPFARAHLLVERVRTGALRLDRLRLAAYLGDPAACLASGGQRPGLVDAVAWVRHLEYWGMEPLARAAIAAAESILPTWDRYRASDRRPCGAVAASVAWVLCPCGSCEAVARAAAEGAALASDALVAELDGAWTDEAHQAMHASQAARYCAYSARATRPPVAEEFSGAFITDGDDAATCVAEVIYGLAGAETNPFDPELPAAQLVMSAIRDALVPWALALEPPESLRREDVSLGHAPGTGTLRDEQDGSTFS